MSEILDVKLIHETRSGSLIKSPAKIQIAEGRIYFLKSPYALKNEIKAMAGSRWHGFDDENPRKIWSVKDCPRNLFQLGYLMGEDVYAWFDRELVRHEYRPYYKNGERTDPMPHQYDMADSGLTYHYQIWAATMGVGKGLSAQMVIEHSDTEHWFWVGPARSLPNIEREFRIWGYDESKQIDFMSYERLVRLMDSWRDGDSLPQGVIFDECSKLKTASRQRSEAAQLLANRIRERYRFDGYVIEMSGTPSPKKPTDWWSLAEIAWPGFLREGSVKALEQRLAFMVQEEYANGAFWKAIGWKDDERKCEVCGKPTDDPCHMIDDFMGGIDDTTEDAHKFVPSKNEVAFMYERLKGLVVIKHKKDCLSLPDKRYRKIVCTPKSSLLRVAKAIVDAAANAMTGMTMLRELSDGFQYREEGDGTTACNHCPDACGEVEEWFDPADENRTFTNVDMLDVELVARLKKRKITCPKCQGCGEVVKMKRFAREVPCPKEEALRDLLEENEETGRIVIFAGFTGSVDRCVRICRKDGWSVVRCDGRGYQVTLANGEVITNVEALDYWADTASNPRVAFVAHPESGGMSLTLTEARMAVFWSNSYKPEYRVQAEDRIHRKGMDENLGCTIVDLIHLPTDERVLEIIRENRRLELLSMGEIMQDISFESSETEAAHA